jgi:hypothetical protein
MPLLLARKSREPLERCFLAGPQNTPYLVQKMGDKLIRIGQQIQHDLFGGFVRWLPGGDGRSTPDAAPLLARPPVAFAAQLDKLWQTPGKKACCKTMN